MDLTDEMDILPDEDARLDGGAQLGVGVRRVHHGGERLGAVGGGGGGGALGDVPAVRPWRRRTRHRGQARRRWMIR